MSNNDDLALRQAQLSEAKRMLLQERLRGKKRGAPPAQRIPRRADQGPPPLSFSQQRLWFIDQLMPGNPSFNIPSVLRLEGALNIAALQHGLDEIVRRHEILRTTFTVIDGQPIQVIALPAPVPVPLLDLRHRPTATREAEVTRLAAEEAQRPFDLATGPLWRARLVRLDEQIHVLFLTMHHIVADEWSIGVFVRELTALYTADDHGTPLQLAELPIQYADFAVWQRQWLQGEALDHQLAYWKQHLAGAPPMLELPTDRPRLAMQTFHGASQSFMLPRRLSDELILLSRREEVTLFMTLLAALQTLLYRYTGQDQIVVSSGVANRNRRETEALIGCLINIILLRTDLSGDPSFYELLGRVREVALGAYAYQDLPFEKLVQALQPERDLSYHPFSQVMFVLLNAPTEPLAIPGLTLHPIVLENTTTQYDLLLHMWMEPEGLAGRLRYSTDLFDAPTIGRLLDHFQTVLEGIVADPRLRLSTLPILTEAERHQLLVKWNDTRTPFAAAACLHELFEAQVEQRPDAIAAICEETQLSYGELNRRANQLAHHLRSLGVGPDLVVGISVERSLDLAVGLVGILKAGAAYLPLDPAYPKERLAFMLDDAEVPVLLTQQRLLMELPEHASQIVCLDADWARIACESTENPTSGVTAENLAYIIYTSGSTGKPKGVMLDHRGRVNNFTDFNRRFTVGPHDRLLALSSLSFDMCAYDVFGSLAAGATVVLPAALVERDTAHWAELMVRHHVTVWHSAPALLELLVEHISNHPEVRPHALRLALLGGDWIPVSLPDRLSDIVAGVQVISLGGATEVSMDSIIYPIERRDPTWRSIPYGRPMANQLAYVLDARLQLVPTGVPGELHLGGVGVAWGYLNRPELTAEKFVPHPFVDADAQGGPALAPGARLYKTGDLARYMPDGTIELLGRMDHQVKVRGVRIELGEIVARLNQHPAIEEAVVVVRDDAPGDKRLVAYFISGKDPAPSVAELRGFLRETLPDYMTPSIFVPLEALPLSPNGKVDRKALPMPDLVRPELQTAFVPPRTPLEEVVAGVWRQVLAIDQIGIHDNFFELGGHSLLATQVISRLRDVFQIEVLLRTLFQAPTVASLAESLEAIGGSAQRDIMRIAQIFRQVSQLTEEEAGTMLAQLSSR
jgi:amino acid adenylation domain-containing protein